MKKQHERISSKIFPNWCQAEIDDNISYDLSYTNLDKKLNNNIFENQSNRTC